MRWTTLIVGDIFTALGVAFFFRTYMPLQVFELFVAEIAAKFKLNVNKTKMVFDLTLLAFSIALALALFAGDGGLDIKTLATSDFHSIGLGTLVTTLINSPPDRPNGQPDRSAIRPHSALSKTEIMDRSG